MFYILIAFLALGICEILYHYGWDIVKVYIIEKLSNLEQ